MRRFNNGGQSTVPQELVPIFLFCSHRSLLLVPSGARGLHCRAGGTVKTKTYFSFRVDVWDEAGNSIVEHVAGIDDFETAVATYWGAIRRWPKAKITLRQGARVLIRNWQE
jgi:hypothetical protein